ncbi:60S ribosomal protein L7a-like [Portunus trituberculatus]|uniref:60S ribosomal protein L7a-like n=1 Tax=Portunus trituberculatus TaxID=210409 RepID=UPI001E1CE01B|nr:60S ribosomal protein L7a-like [Portunus trituberculatus]
MLRSLRWYCSCLPCFARWAFMKNKSHLGTVVSRKKAACMAITDVEANDRSNLNKLLESIKTNYDHFDKIRKNWGGGLLGAKSASRIAKARELAQKC